MAQVRELLDQAETNTAARQVLTAYLAGAGETAGILIDTAVNRGVSLAACKHRLSLDQNAVRRALESAAPNSRVWRETAATPLIVRDMVRRAECNIAD